MKKELFFRTKKLYQKQRRQIETASHYRGKFSQIFGLFSDAEGLVQKEIQKELTEKPICDVEFQEVKIKFGKSQIKILLTRLLKL